MPEKRAAPSTRSSSSISSSTTSSCVTSPAALGDSVTQSGSLTTSSSLIAGGGGEGTAPPAWRSDLSTANTSYSDALYGRDDALQLLERHVEVMTLLFQHITTCPPHGPFRYYSAMTFLQRARCYFGHTATNEQGGTELTARNVNGVSDDAAHKSSGGNGAVSEPRPVHPPQVPSATQLVARDVGQTTHAAALAEQTSSCNDDVLHAITPYCAAPEHVLAALTMPNILALMERYYNTRHLCAWPLLYVPAEIHLDDVTELERQHTQK